MSISARVTSESTAGGGVISARKSKALSAMKWPAKAGTVAMNSASSEPRGRMDGTVGGLYAPTNAIPQTVGA